MEVSLKGDSMPANALFGAAFTTLMHPITYARVLIQVGYEPVAPKPSTTIFGRKVLIYPNVFQYIGYIRQQDGFTGMYCGLVPRLCSGIVGSFVTSSMTNHFKEQHPTPGLDEIDGDDVGLFKKMAVETTHETIARCFGAVAAQPFQVIMVRSMVQFVGKETHYNSIFGSISEIYHEEGILGFFKGLVPRLLCEVITIWVANVLAHVVDTYLVPKVDAIKGMTMPFTSLGVSHVTYPFTLISNVMAANTPRLAGGSPPNMFMYKGWTDCWSQLSKQGQLKRGSSLFWRYYVGTLGN